ncbi:peptidoglycan editing factor PgeF [Proteobacteria bacterium 005FR1]|nr:peptidoglycan editing factor PgeF [Proteobacteria bacterium 005FR1]
MTGPVGFVPTWPAPESVGSFVTCRTGGCSRSPYDSNNLGTHVGDDPQSVAENRRRLRDYLLIDEPCWLEQVHGTGLVEAGSQTGIPVADGSFTRRPGAVSAVLTADCLPLLLCDQQGEQVAAVHCGWRGLAAGIIPLSLDKFSAAAGSIMAYLGPAISGRHYEVGDEVREALDASLKGNAAAFSKPVEHKPGHFLVDLYAVARAQLKAAGIAQIYGGDRCTFAEAEHFYSYRRDGVTGRMATLIWLK